MAKLETKVHKGYHKNGGGIFWEDVCINGINYGVSQLWHPNGCRNAIVQWKENTLHGVYVPIRY